MSFSALRPRKPNRIERALVVEPTLSLVKEEENICGCLSQAFPPEKCLLPVWRSSGSYRIAGPFGDLFTWTDRESKVRRVDA